MCEESNTHGVRVILAIELNIEPMLLPESIRRARKSTWDVYATCVFWYPGHNLDIFQNVIISVAGQAPST